MVRIHIEVRLLGAAEQPEAAGVVCAVVELCVPGAVGGRAAHILFA